MQEPKQLYRSSKDVILGGVCSGIARYLNVDITIIRIVFVLITLFWGSGLVLYLLLWIFIPQEPAGYEFGQTYNQDYNNNFKQENMNTENQQNPDEFMKNYHEKQKTKKDNANFVGGIILITVGVLFLISEYIPHVDFGDLWPIILIVIGGLMLRNNYLSRKQKENNDNQNQE